MAISPAVLYASEVYYLGGPPGALHQLNPSFSFPQRLYDLVDFPKFGQYGQDRSGEISGNLLEEVDTNNVGGNRSKSFLKDGTESLTELHLNLQEKLPQDYNMEGQLFLRKTNDTQIQKTRDLRVLQGNLKILNANNLFEVGDFYGEFSQFVLGHNLEGIGAEYVPDNSIVKAKFVAGRSQAPDEGADKFERNVVGGKVDINPFNNSNIFSNFRIGAQVLSSYDDSSSIPTDANTVDLHNSVGSIDGDMSFKKIASMSYEVARSADMANKFTLDDYKYGNALRLQPRLDFGPLQLRYLYYYVEPRFYSDIGSAAWDKAQHQVTADYTFNQKVSMSATENYYWNHLKDSPSAFRTINDEKDLSFNLKPLDSRKDFSIRPYATYLQTNSDDSGDSLHSTTKTFGFTTNDSWGPSINYGVKYEFQNFISKANPFQSVYYERPGFNVSREQKFFGRRLYFSFQPGVQIRTLKSSNGKSDVNFTYSSTGQYNCTDKLVFNFGLNATVDNSDLPLSDSFGTQSFAEFDYTLSEKRSTHFVVRLEKNRYVYTDGTQSYKESRVIGKLVTNF